MTHCERILDYIEKNGSISPKEAEHHFGCMRLSGRIYDLKKRGYKFSVANEVSTNRFGEPCHYARYTLIGKPA